MDATAGSFAARQSPTLGIVERMRFSMARTLTTDEARDTCEAAAAPTDAASRQASTISAANAVSGEWRIIRNGAGECATACYCSARVCGALEYVPHAAYGEHEAVQHRIVPANQHSCKQPATSG
jgi:hypothetical protein